MEALRDGEPNQWLADGMRRQPEHDDSILVVTDEEGQPTSTDAETDDARIPPVRGSRCRRSCPYARQLRRMNGGRATSLTVEGMQLVRQVEDLRCRRDELMALHIARLLDTRRQDHLVTTVLQYYDTFSSGYSTPRVHGIFQYLNNHIDREVFQYGATGLGTDVWIEQWRRYTKLFPSISIRVRATTCSSLIDPGDVHAVTDAMTTLCIVEAQGRTAGVVSRNAIAAILPHVLHREDLLSKLLGKPLDCPVGLRFYFNSAGRVIRIDLDVDFFRGFHNVETVTVMVLVQIMDGADIGENSMLPALE